MVKDWNSLPLHVTMGVRRGGQEKQTPVKQGILALSLLPIEINKINRVHYLNNEAGNDSCFFAHILTQIRFFTHLEYIHRTQHINNTLLLAH